MLSSQCGLLPLAAAGNVSGEGAGVPEYSFSESSRTCVAENSLWEVTCAPWAPGWPNSGHALTTFRLSGGDENQVHPLCPRRGRDPRVDEGAGQMSAELAIYCCLTYGQGLLFPLTCQ